MMSSSSTSSTQLHVLRPRWYHSLGCLLQLVCGCSLCLMPLFLWDAMTSALQRLHLSPWVAAAAMLAIIVGGLVNIPLYRLERDTFVPTEVAGVFGLSGVSPWLVEMQRETVVSVNVGGCVIPTLLALWQLPYLVAGGSGTLIATAVTVGASIAACYVTARPVRGIGIALPVFVPVVVSVLLAKLLVGAEHLALQAPVAFVAGVTGPLVGADLLHLRRLAGLSSGVFSIGGAGTFDGIVIAGLAAAFFA